MPIGTADRENVVRNGLNTVRSSQIISVGDRARGRCLSIAAQHFTGLSRLATLWRRECERECECNVRPLMRRQQ
eukprot:scaffold2553_cov162-Skeletonema_marinoi.AAC.12